MGLDLSFTVIVQTSEENIRVLFFSFSHGGLVLYIFPLWVIVINHDRSLVQFWFQEVALVYSEYQRKRLRGLGDEFICPVYSPCTLAPFLRDWQLQNGSYLQTQKIEIMSEQFFRTKREKEHTIWPWFYLLILQISLKKICDCLLFHWL